MSTEREILESAHNLLVVCSRFDLPGGGWNKQIDSWLVEYELWKVTSVWNEKERENE